MAERQSRKRRRQPSQQRAEQRAESHPGNADSSSVAAVRVTDASTQTSPPPSPRKSGEDEVDLSCLLLQPQQIFDSIDWLAWVQLSGFTRSNATSIATTAAMTGTAAATAGPAPTPASSSPLSDPPSTSVSYSASSLAPYGARGISSTPMPRQLSAVARPNTSFVAAAGLMSTADMSGECAHTVREPKRTPEGTSGPSDSSLPSAVTSSSMFHLRPSSAVVLPLNGLRAPLVDTHQRQPPHAPHVNGLSRPALLPWMNKPAAAAVSYRTHIG